MSERIKTKLTLASIIILSLFLRLIGINKPGGLWYDEIEGYYNAAASFPLGVMKNVIENSIHPPLYFLFLHLWMDLFGNGDAILRLFSVLWGISIIPVMYLIGKELKSKGLGLILACLISINSLFIYYSQEIRYYSLFIFLVALSVLFMLKIIKNPYKRNYAGFILSNTACLYACSLGVLFVGLETLALIIYLYCSNRSKIKEFLFVTGITSVAYTPYLAVLISHVGVLNKSFVGIFDWAKFYPQCILFVIQDWFSPVLINIYNYPLGFYNKVLSNGIPPFFILFICLPVSIFLFAIIKSAFAKNKSVYIMFSVGLIIFAIEIFMSMLGKFNIVSRYTMSSGLLFIIIAGYGIASFNNKFLKNFLMISILLINFIFIAISPIAAPKMVRQEGLRYVSEVLNKYNVSSNDIIIMPYGGRYLFKYDNNKKFNVINFDITRTYFACDRNQLLNVMDQGLIDSLNQKNAYDKLQPYLSSSEPAPAIENFINKEIRPLLKTNSRIFFVSAKELNIYDEVKLKIATSFMGEDIYKSQSLLFMLTSKNANDIIKILNRNYKFKKTQSIKVWEIYVWEK